MVLSWSGSSGICLGYCGLYTNIGTVPVACDLVSIFVYIFSNTYRPLRRSVAPFAGFNKSGDIRNSLEKCIVKVTMFDLVVLIIIIPHKTQTTVCFRYSFYFFCTAYKLLPALFHINTK